MEEEDFVLQIARILYYMIHESGFEENTLATVLKKQLARLRGKNCVALASAAVHGRTMEKLQWLKQHPGSASGRLDVFNPVVYTRVSHVVDMDTSE